MTTVSDRMGELAGLQWRHPFRKWLKLTAPDRFRGFGRGGRGEEGEGEGRVASPHERFDQLLKWLKDEWARRVAVRQCFPADLLGFLECCRDQFTAKLLRKAARRLNMYVHAIRNIRFEPNWRRSLFSPFMTQT